MPRNFTNPKFNKVRTPGEMMWVLKNGSLGQTGQIPGTGMLPIVGQFLSEEEGWKGLLYERSRGGGEKTLPYGGRSWVLGVGRRRGPYPRGPALGPFRAGHAVRVS